MCCGPYREKVTEIDGGFVKEEDMDLKREGFQWTGGRENSRHGKGTWNKFRNRVIYFY